MYNFLCQSTVHYVWLFDVSQQKGKCFSIKDIMSFQQDSFLVVSLWLIDFLFCSVSPVVHRCQVTDWWPEEPAPEPDYVGNESDPELNFVIKGPFPKEYTEDETWLENWKVERKGWR